eukprot:7920092-Alexandrium_andersonii.AAC.1
MRTACHAFSGSCPACRGRPSREKHGLASTLPLTAAQSKARIGEITRAMRPNSCGKASTPTAGVPTPPRTANA